MGTPVRRTNRMDTPNRYRTIWLSDVHLGTRACKAEFLLDFLRHNESDYLYLVGDVVNHVYNRLRRRLGLPYWSLAAYLKHKAKKAVQYIADFEEAVAREARQAGVEGIVCGHIHHAELRRLDGVLYANCGDWVESCTALVEHLDGRLETVRWVTIDHHTRLPDHTALSGDGLPEQPAVAARAGTVPHHPA